MDTKSAVRKIIDRTDPEQRACSISDDESLFDGGVLDSLRMGELIALIEQEFGFRIESQDLNPENFESINCISSFVARSTKP